jgi:hypothetical protein
MIHGQDLVQRSWRDLEFRGGIAHVGVVAVPESIFVQSKASTLKPGEASMRNSGTVDDEIGIESCGCGIFACAVGDAAEGGVRVGGSGYASDCAGDELDAWAVALDKPPEEGLVSSTSHAECLGETLGVGRRWSWDGYTSNVHVVFSRSEPE